MSLINEMLRDLQQQKKAAGTARPEAVRLKEKTRLPLSSPAVLLGGGALVVLLFAWWLAGALADLMFGLEPPQQVAVTRQGGSAAEAGAAEPDQLTAAEREAEPAPESESEQTAATGLKAAVVPTAALVAVAETPPPPSGTLKTQAAAPTLAASQRVEQKTRLAQARPVQTQTPRQSVAESAKRLHPDELPGAVLTPANQAPEPEIIDRPSRAPATTPYGMAEEAFLDGRWALDQQRTKLAVRSLEHALGLYPGHLPARELLVETLAREGKSGEAMLLLAEGLEIAPDHILFKKSYARMLVEQGDYDAATRVMLAGGLPSAEEDPEAHVVLASLYQRLGEAFLAAQTYRNLLVAWPQTGAFWVGLGSALETQDLPGEALECYRRALATNNLRQELRLFAEKRLLLLK